MQNNFLGVIGLAALLGCSTNTSFTGSPVKGAGVYDPVEHKKLVQRGKIGLQEVSPKSLGMPHKVAPPPEEEFTACFNRLEEDPDLSSLKGKIALMPKQGQSFDILTNNSKPTKAEKVAIRAYSEKAMACMSILDAPFKAAPSEARDAFNKSKNGMQSLLASLYVSEITYGGYARNLTDLMSRERTAIDKAVSDEKRQIAERENLQIQQNIERDKAYSASQQARATEDLVSAQRSANWIRMMQGFQQNLYQPQSINCTSRQSFGTVNTTCY